MTSSSPPAGVPKRAIIMTVLGVTQIMAWGSSYYLPAVIAPRVAADTGWPLGWVVGGLSLGLLVAGLISPRVGSSIERRGGRRVLAFSAVAIGVGQIGLAAAPNLVAYIIAWLVIGLGVGAGLYDAAFATLGRLYGYGARSAITTLTLFGSFASTVCWPISAFLMAEVGWRGACLSYAAVQLLIALPLYLFVLPRAAEEATAKPAQKDPAASPRDSNTNLGTMVLFGHDAHACGGNLFDIVGPFAHDPAEQRHGACSRRWAWCFGRSIPGGRAGNRNGCRPLPPSDLDQIRVRHIRCDRRIGPLGRTAGHSSGSCLLWSRNWSGIDCAWNTSPRAVRAVSLCAADGAPCDAQLAGTGGGSVCRCVAVGAGRSPRHAGCALRAGLDQRRAGVRFGLARDASPEPTGSRLARCNVALAASNILPTRDGRHDKEAKPCARPDDALS